MLRDSPIRPKEGDLPRRWISDDFFDLIIWYQPDEIVHGFQLCYDKGREERALTWVAGRGFNHSRIDPGDDLPTDNRTPVLIHGGAFPAGFVTEEFRKRSVDLPPAIRHLVLSRLREFRSSARLLPYLLCASAAIISIAVAWHCSRRGR